MSHDPSRVLELRYRDLADTDDDAEFLRQMRRYLDALAAHDQVRRLVARLEAASEEACSRFDDRLEEAVHQLIDVRHRLAQDTPQADNSDEEPSPPDSAAYSRWKHDSFATFDRIAAQPRTAAELPLIPRENEVDVTVIPTLLMILRRRLSAAQRGASPAAGAAPLADVRPDVDLYEDQISDVGQKHKTALSELRQDGLTLPGAAYGRLSEIARLLRPQPRLHQIGESDQDEFDRAVTRVAQEMGEADVLRRAADGDRLTAQEQATVHEMVDFLRGEARRLQTELLHGVASGAGLTRQQTLFRWAGRGSLRAGKWVVSVAGAALITLLVGTLYARSLGGGQSHEPATTGGSRPPPVSTGRYRSLFVGENLPDGTVVPPDTRLVKEWTIENVGGITWRHLTLRRVSPYAASDVSGVPVPVTVAGARCVLRVAVTTPGRPGRITERWALFRADGRRLFPPGSELTFDLSVR